MADRCSGKSSEYNKSVREFDIVTLDRVRRMDIEADLDVWMEYAWKKEIHGSILAYLGMKKIIFIPWRIQWTGSSL